MTAGREVLHHERKESARQRGPGGLFAGFFQVVRSGINEDNGIMSHRTANSSRKQRRYLPPPSGGSFARAAFPRLTPWATVFRPTGGRSTGCGAANVRERLPARDQSS